MIITFTAVAYVLLTDCTLYESTNHWHSQAIIQTGINGSIAGWLSKSTISSNWRATASAVSNNGRLRERELCQLGAMK